MRHSFLDQHADIDSPVHRLDARAKIVFFVGLIVLAVSTPPDRWVAFVGYFALLAAVILASRVPVGYVLMRALIVLAFVLVMAALIPFLKAGGRSYSLGLGRLRVSRSGLLMLCNVAGKSLLSVLCVIALTSTTKFAKLLAGLRQLRAPALVVTLLGFAYRYVFLLVDEAERMQRARDSRAFRGRWLWQAGVMGRMIGTLFLRSYERGERVHLAMLARGFDGGAVALEGGRMSSGDYAFVAVGLVAVAALRLAAGSFALQGMLPP